MTLIEFLIWLNAAGALVYFCLHWKDGSVKYLAFGFLAVPVAGFLIYGICFWILKKGWIKGYDREHLTQRYSVQNGSRDIDLKQALGVSPLEDVLAVGDKYQRRSLLLSGLKKGVSENYKSYLKASNDEDSETAHYIASAKMTVFRELYEKFSRCSENYEENPTLENERSLLLSIDALIRSELLSEEEVKMYHMLFCSVITNCTRHQSDIQEMYFESLRSMMRYSEMEQIWKQIGAEQKTEAMYMSMLNIYYARRMPEEFRACMDDLKHSPLTLTPDGLQRLRFWDRKGIR